MMMTMSMAEYMQDRRKEIDKHVQGEHAWLGDCSTMMPSLSMYEGTRPWYLNNDTLGRHQELN